MLNDLIVFGEDWHGLPSSTQHLIKHLSTDRKVVWINSIGLRQPELTLKDAKRVLAKIMAKFTQQATEQSETNTLDEVSNDRFILVNPVTLPAPKSKLARKLAVKMLLTQLKPILSKANLHQPILWTSLPTAVDFIGELNESAVAYYCGDDFSGLAGVDHHTVNLREQTLLQRADLVMASSELLVKRFPESKTHLLTHGVDFDLFSQSVTRATDLPSATKNIAGFYGSISQWLDLDLLHDTIKALPHWHFVFIGKAVVDVSKISQFDNVCFLGERPHHLLPHYSQHWTASLLPFVDNKQIRACNPLKLREYLAAGKPIIATSFPALAPYKGLVQIANSSAAMVEALTASEHVAQLPSFSSALRGTIKKDTWAAKSAQVSQWLETL